MKYIVIIALAIISIYFFDFSFIKGQITEYSLVCNKDRYIDYHCTEKWLPLNPTTYKPDINKQTVLYWTLDDIKTLKNCSVVDRRNWTCTYDDSSAEFGFKDGSFWETSLKNSSIAEEFLVYRYVPKFIYRIEEMKWW